jgi:hypothetical protein
MWLVISHLLTSSGPQRVHTDVVRTELLVHPQDAHGHPVLGHGVSHVVFEPKRVHVERWGQVQNMSVIAFLQIWKTLFGSRIFI